MSHRWFPKPVLAIESSCDETAAAVLDGPHILSNCIASQIDVHRKWGGVVPEAAARMHVEAIIPIILEALDEASVSLGEIGGIAVTNRPGLIGSLSVGTAAAKSLAHALNIPWIGIHHLEGHIWSVLAGDPDFSGDAVTLIASGGHTELVRVKSFGDCQILGETRDDAAGEAFDKCSRILGLGFPGGIAIQKAATGAARSRYSLPQAKVGPCEFSFSGLKTAVSLLAEREGANLVPSEAAAAVQDAIAVPLAEKTIAAAQAAEASAVCVVGGVSANLRLRELIQAEADRFGLHVLLPPLSLCTDNAAMIGLAGSIRLAKGQFSLDEEDVSSSADLPGLE